MKNSSKILGLFILLSSLLSCSMPLSILNDADSSSIYKAWDNRFCTGDMHLEGNTDIRLRLSNYRLYGSSVLDKAPRLPACRYYLLLVTSGYSPRALPTPSALSIIIDEETVPINIAFVSTSGAKGKYLLSNAQDSPATPNADVYEMQPFSKKIVYYEIDATLIKRMVESNRLLLKMDNKIYDLMKLDTSKRYAPLTFIEGCKKFYSDVVLIQCGPVSANPDR